MPSMKLDSKTKLRVISWSMYDFANTIFSFIVVTYYLPPLLNVITGSNFVMGFANVFSMFLAAFTAPVLGALTDRSPRAKRWLILVTSICCVACVIIGLLASPEKNPGIIRCLAIGLAFIIANFTYQLGLMFYNSFLPVIVNPRVMGKVSGLGIALGYVGTLVISYPAKLISTHKIWLVFPFCGLMFLLFSLPMFIFIPERKPLKKEEMNISTVLEELKKFFRLIKTLKGNKNLLYCLLANFLAVDAVNTAIIFFTTFLENAVWYDVSDKTAKINGIYWQMMALIVSSIVMSFIFGWLSDRIGSKRSFFIAALSMGLAAISGCLLPRGILFFLLVTLFGGAGLAGVWTTGRKMLADITPAGKEGEYFGLYGLTNKSSALGIMFFACITYFLPKWGLMSRPLSYRMAFLFAIVTVAGSLYFLRKVRIKVSKN
jgi:UMF1 family MFS transporter